MAAGGRFARVEDLTGRLAALTFAETTVLLASGRVRSQPGLLPLPGLLGREEAARIAAAAGARIVTGTIPPT